MKIDPGLIARLEQKGCSCVISSQGEVRLFHGRGVGDLYRLLTEEPAWLKGASVADKVVGKGAAALMILGKVASLYAAVISRGGLELLEQYGLPVEYGRVVEVIMNRTQTDCCPVEKRCAGCRNAEECLIEITNFMQSR